MRVALFVVLTACGRIGFDAGGDGTTSDGGTGDGAALTDGASDDGTNGGCADVEPATTFPGGGPCDDWGGNLSLVNAGYSLTNGYLQFTPNANAPGAFAACTRSNVTFTDRGVFAEVSDVLDGTMATTRLEVITGGVTYYIGTANNGMRAGTDSGVSFTGGGISRWWRIVPRNGEIRFEVSNDGTAWVNFAGLGATVTNPVQLRIRAATPVAEGNVGVARFEGVNACPE